MLKIYLASVIIYYIVIYATVKITSKRIMENGWLDDMQEENVETLDTWLPLYVSAIPVIRLLVVIGFYVMFLNKKEK